MSTVVGSTVCVEAETVVGVGGRVDAPALERRCTCVAASLAVMPLAAMMEAWSCSHSPASRPAVYWTTAAAWTGGGETAPDDAGAEVVDVVVVVVVVEVEGVDLVGPPSEVDGRLLFVPRPLFLRGDGGLGGRTGDLTGVSVGLGWTTDLGKRLGDSLSSVMKLMSPTWMVITSSFSTGLEKSRGTGVDLRLEEGTRADWVLPELTEEVSCSERK